MKNWDDLEDQIQTLDVLIEVLSGQLSWPEGASHGELESFLMELREMRNQTILTRKSEKICPATVFRRSSPRVYHGK